MGVARSRDTGWPDVSPSIESCGDARAKALDGGPARCNSGSHAARRIGSTAGRRAVTGDEGTKREGERQEDRGKLKGKLDSAVGKAQDALEALKDKADRR